MKAMFLEEFARFFGPKRLNVGCGAASEPGWTNMDFNPQAEGVLKWDLRSIPWPFALETFDTVMASHVLEHFSGEDLFKIVFEASRVLKAGGFLIAAVPYATHSSAYANPFHRSLWDESTPPQFSKRLYEQPDTAGTGAHQFMPLADWSVVHLGLTPDPRWMGLAAEEITAARLSQLNVIQEMQFVLRKES